MSCLAPVARLLDHVTPHCEACSQRDLRADRFDGRGPNPGYSIEVIYRRKRTVLLPVVDKTLKQEIVSSVEERPDEVVRDDDWDCSAPRYSPDGQRLAFIASHQEIGRAHV